MKLQAINGINSVLDRHELLGLRTGRDTQTVRQTLLHGGERMISGGWNDCGETAEKRTVRGQGQLGLLSMHEMPGVGHCTAESLTDGLM